MPGVGVGPWKVRKKIKITKFIKIIQTELAAVKVINIPRVQLCLFLTQSRWPFARWENPIISSCWWARYQASLLLFSRQVHFALFCLYPRSNWVGIFHCCCCCCCCREDGWNKTYKKRRKIAKEQRTRVVSVWERERERREKATAALAPGHLSRWAPMIFSLGWNPPKCRTIYLFIGDKM